MGLLNLLNTGASDYGYSGDTVPSTTNTNPPGFTRHNLFSTNGTPNMSSKIIVGGVNGLQAPPVTYLPSNLEEKDRLNTAAYRSNPGQGYLDNLPG